MGFCLAESIDQTIVSYTDLLCRYSFSVPPKLDLLVRPKLGEREVTFCHVTEWIEKKLQDEFQVETATAI